MISNIKLISSFLFCFILFACSEQDETCDIVLHPLRDAEHIDNVSNYASIIEIIELPSEELIGDILKMILTSKGDMIILDSQGKIFHYDVASGSIRTILNKGRSKNEYLNISDIAITDNDILILLDDNVIKNVDINNNQVISTVNIPYNIVPDAISPCNDSYYLFSAFPMNPSNARKQKDYLLYKLSSNNIEQYVRREDCTFSLFNISQSAGNDYYLRPQNNRGVFYKLDVDGIKPQLQVNFDRLTIPSRYYYDVANENITQYMISQYYKLPMNLLVTDESIYFHCCGPDAMDLNYFYSRSLLRGVCWESTKYDHIMRFLTCDESCFYASFSNFDEDSMNSYGAMVKFIKSHLDNCGYKKDGLYIVKIKPSTISSPLSS